MQKRPNGFISLQEGNFHTPFGDEFHPQPQMAMYRTVAYPCLDNLLTLAKRWLKLCSLPCSFVYSCYPPSSQWPLLGSCRGGRTCALQPGPRVSTSGVPPRPGVPPGSCFQGAHGLGRWLPPLLGGVPRRSSWLRRACMGRPRATFSGRHKSFPMQFLAARADWSQAPPGFDHLLEHQLVSAVGHPLASPQGLAANSSSTLAWLASPWCPVW